MQSTARSATVVSDLRLREIEASSCASTPPDPASPLSYLAAFPPSISACIETTTTTMMMMLLWPRIRQPNQRPPIGSPSPNDTLIPNMQCSSGGCRGESRKTVYDRNKFFTKIHINTKILQALVLSHFSQTYLVFGCFWCFSWLYFGLKWPQMAKVPKVNIIYLVVHWRRRRRSVASSNAYLFPPRKKTP